ncbi:hypothetical protein BJX70DRAFT_409687 [Aspergillus crustosus]
MIACDMHNETVCRICKARKKKCDKALPHCGYCTRKGIQCQYQEQPVSPPIQLPGNASSTNESTLSHQAQHLIQCTGQYFDEVSVRYFSSTHHFMPIIARTRFHNQLISFGAQPQTDFAMLLLSMSLLTYSPSSDKSGQTALKVSDLYLAAKILLCQAQTLCTPSLNLVQAGVLFAVLEYARGEPEQALMTISVYARMAYAAGLERPSSLPSSVQVDDEEDVDNAILSGFRHAAQATCLLDQVLQTTLSPEPDFQGQLDQSLQTFLAQMMHQFPIATEGNCGAIAIAIRALFLLHRRILGTPGYDAETHHTSHAALETVSKIVVDIALAHQELSTPQLATLPPSCLYIIRAALALMQTAGRDLSFAGGGAESHLRRSLDRWGI